jgi:hypothetical protein
MKQYFLGLAGLALLGGPLLAQGPPPPPVPHGPPCDVPGGAPVAVLPERAGHHHHHPDYVCVPEHYTKKKDKWVYNCGSEPLCLCYFHGLFRHCHCGDSGHCERPYTRRYLVKKIRHCEEDDIKCVPQPACAGGHCGAGPGPAGVTGHAAPPPVVAPGPVYPPGSPRPAPGTVIPPMP